MEPTPSFDHVHYRSTDFVKTREFYVGVMGAIDLGTIDLILGGKATPNLQLELGGVTLLFAPSDQDPESAVPATERLGVYHIAFLVADCRAATEYYEARGAVVAKQPAQVGDNIIASFLQAPDGMWVELKQIIEAAK